jgi:hypothetical protein
MGVVQCQITITVLKECTEILKIGGKVKANFFVDFVRPFLKRCWRRLFFPFE